MDIDVILYRYKNQDLIKRCIGIFFLSLLPAGYYYFAVGEGLQIELQSQMAIENDLKAKAEKYSKNRDELPALKAKLSDIEEYLINTRKVLPDKIQIEDILGLVAKFEKDLGVQTVRFAPEDGGGFEQATAENYREIPMTLIVKGEFRKVMAFFDQMVHLEKVTHLGDMNIQSDTAEDNKNGMVTAKARLLLYESLGAQNL